MYNFPELPLTRLCGREVTSNDFTNHEDMTSIVSSLESNLWSRNVRI